MSVKREVRCGARLSAASGTGGHRRLASGVATGVHGSPNRPRQGLRGRGLRGLLRPRVRREAGCPGRPRVPPPPSIPLPICLGPSRPLPGSRDQSRRPACPSRGPNGALKPATWGPSTEPDLPQKGERCRARRRAGPPQGRGGHRVGRMLRRPLGEARRPVGRETRRPVGRETRRPVGREARRPVGRETRRPVRRVGPSPRTAAAPRTRKSPRRRSGAHQLEREGTSPPRSSPRGTGSIRPPRPPWPARALTGPLPPKGRRRWRRTG